LDVGEFLGVLGCEFREGVAGRRDVEGVDVCGVVGEADFGEAQADALVCAGDCRQLLVDDRFADCAM
jgi:hypothetical protein